MGKTAMTRWMDKLRSGSAPESRAAAIDAKPEVTATAGEVQEAVDEEPEPPRWLGFIDFADHRRITGWACDRQNLDRIVTLQGVAPNGRRALCTTGIYRDDVRKAGYGQGFHGFQMEIDQLEAGDGPIAVSFVASGVSLLPEAVALDAYAMLLWSVVPSRFTRALQRLTFDVRSRHAELEPPVVTEPRAEAGHERSSADAALIAHGG